MLDHPNTSAVISQRRVIKLMLKLLKHRCIFHTSGAAFHRLIAHGVRVPVPCPEERDARGSLCLGGAAGAGDTLAGPARAGDRVGTGAVDKTVTAARFSCWHVHIGWARAEDLHTQSTLNLVLSLYDPFVWTADSLSLCPTSGYFRS